MNVQRWDTYEVALAGPGNYDNPFRDAELRGTFTHKGTWESITIQVNGGKQSIRFFGRGQALLIRAC